MAQRAQPTEVAQGRYHGSGHADYDEFFVALFRLQVELKHAPGALSSARAALARTLSMKRTASDPEADQTAAELADLSKRMSEAKQRLERLRASIPRLEQNLAATFQSQGAFKQEVVRRNLGDGERVISLMLIRASDVDQSARQSLSELKRARDTTPRGVTTDAAQTTPRPGWEERPKFGRIRSRSSGPQRAKPGGDQNAD